MKLSHIIIKVNDLDKAVREWTDKGFVVEYGRKKNPINAIIYFKEGPYVELYNNCGMPYIAKKILRIFGKKDLIDRFDDWDSHTPGPIGLEVETYEKTPEAELKKLDGYGEKYTVIKSGRNDTKGRKMKFYCVFPDSVKIPAFMTYFSIDPKPKTDIHPNGIKGVKSVSFGTEERLIPLIKEMCDDERLKLFIGEGVKDLEFIL